MRPFLASLAALALLLPAGLSGQASAQNRPQAVQRVPQVEAERPQTLQPRIDPARLTPAQFADHREYQAATFRWLEMMYARDDAQMAQRFAGAAEEYERQAGEVRSTLSGGGGLLGGASGGMSSAGGGMVSEMAQMNMQFLALQNALQSQSRYYQTLSNVSRARHDIAMASIRNMR